MAETVIEAVLPAVSSQPTGALPSARDQSYCRSAVGASGYSMIIESPLSRSRVPDEPAGDLQAGARASPVPCCDCWLSRTALERHCRDLIFGEELRFD